MPRVVTYFRDPDGGYTDPLEQLENRNPGFQLTLITRKGFFCCYVQTSNKNIFSGFRGQP